MSALTASALASAFHLLALGIGLGAVWARFLALKGVAQAAGGPGAVDPAALRRVFTADSWWGLAAALWIGTGLWRALGPVAKTWAFYRMNALFHTKMTVFLLIFLLELMPMIALIRWRIAVKRGQTPDLTQARRFARISLVQAHLVVAMAFLAAFMARGMGMITPS